MDAQERIRWIQSVIAQYEGPLLRFASHMLGGVDRARDVVQDTFFRLCEVDVATIEEHVGSWLFRVCRNRALDVQRKDKPMRQLSDEKLASWEGSEPSPADALEQQQSSQRVVLLLAALPPSQQEVVRLKFQHNLSYREIGEVTGRTANHVGVLLHSAIKTLRELMAAPEALPARSGQ